MSTQPQTQQTNISTNQNISLQNQIMSLKTNLEEKKEEKMIKNMESTSEKIKEEKDPSSLKKLNNPLLNNITKETKPKQFFLASHISNENKQISKEPKVNFSVIKKNNHSNVNNSSNNIEKNQNFSSDKFKSSINFFDPYQRNNQNKKFLNNNIIRNNNFIMPNITMSPLSSPNDIHKKNQEKIGFCYFNEKSFKNLVNELPFLKNNLIENENNSNNTNNLKPSSPSVTKNQKYKDYYLDLLINSADSLIKDGLNINTLKNYIPPSNEKIAHSYHNLKRINNQNTKELSNNNNNNNPNSNHIKCENKICPVIFNKNSTIHKTKAFSLKNHILNLCNLCYQAYKNGQFCYYCGTIYREYKGKKGFNEHKSWIGCDYCKNWEHIQCEEEFGIIPNLSLLIKDHKYKYKCPICRKKDKNYLKHKSSKPQTSDETEEDISSVVKVHKKKKSDYLISSSKKDKNLLNSELYYDIKQIQDLNK